MQSIKPGDLLVLTSTSMLCRNYPPKERERSVEILEVCLILSSEVKTPKNDVGRMFVLTSKGIGWVEIDENDDVLSS